MKAKIKSVYSSDQQGEEYVTTKGNPYIKLKVELENGEIIYTSVFFTKPAHFIVEQIFDACGKPPPTYLDVNYMDFVGIKDIEFEVEHGTDKKGYPKIYKFLPVGSGKPVEIRQPIVEENVPDTSEQSDDPELEEDVPF